MEQQDAIDRLHELSLRMFWLKYEPVLHSTLDAEICQDYYQHGGVISVFVLQISYLLA